MEHYDLNTCIGLLNMGSSLRKTGYGKREVRGPLKLSQAESERSFVTRRVSSSMIMCYRGHMPRWRLQATAACESRLESWHYFHIIWLFWSQITWLVLSMIQNCIVCLHARIGASFGIVLVRRIAIIWLSQILPWPAMHFQCKGSRPVVRMKTSKRTSKRISHWLFG
jgi:hypothetical protein